MSDGNLGAFIGGMQSLAPVGVLFPVESRAATAGDLGLQGGSGLAKRLAFPRVNPSLAAMLEVRELKKSFSAPDAGPAAVVHIRDFSLAAGKECALRGASGCGKTTFLNLVAGILAADSGSVRIDGKEMVGTPEPARDRLRASKIGYIFQTFNLLQGFTVLENVVLGMSFSGNGVDPLRARRLLDSVGLGHRMSHFPRQLSTGQQQRVAVARALANRPSLVLADEPTGNLDPRNSEECLGLVRTACAEQGASLLLVSHDEAVLSRFDSVLDFSSINAALKGGAQ